MQTGAASRFTSATLSVARICALLALAGGLLAALGWIGGAPRLTDWENDGITIKFNAAPCLIIISIALVFALYYPRFSYVVRILGGIVFLVAGATLLENILGINFGIDTLFFPDVPGADAALAPGRMGLPASTAFTLLATAMILGTRSRSRYIGAMLSVAPLCIAALALAGYVFGAQQLYSVPGLTRIALETAIMIAIISIGTAASIPEHGLAGAIIRKDGGGIMLRLTLPFFLIIIIVISWLLFYGRTRDYFSPGTGSAMRTLFEIVVFSSVLWWAARRVAAAEKLSIDALNTLAKNETLQRIAETQETERKRLARDLHDHVGQEVTALRFTLARLCDEKAETSDLIREIKIVCRKMEKLDAEVSDLAWQMRPSVIDADGLIAAIRSFGAEWSANHGIGFDFHASSLVPRLSPEVESNLYRIVQEALNNVAKHAHARRVGATLDVVNGEVRLAIEDDGSGLQDVNGRAANSATNGFGLVGMRERAAVVGGTLEIETAPGAGTTILLNVPLVDKDQRPIPSDQKTYKVAG